MELDTVRSYPSNSYWSGRRKLPGEIQFANDSSILQHDAILRPFIIYNEFSAVVDAQFFWTSLDYSFVGVSNFLHLGCVNFLCMPV